MGGMFALGSYDSNQGGGLRIGFRKEQFTTVGMVWFPYRKEDLTLYREEESKEKDTLPSSCGIQMKLLSSRGGRGDPPSNSFPG